MGDGLSMSFVVDPMYFVVPAMLSNDASTGRRVATPLWYIDEPTGLGIDPQYQF